MSPVTQLFGLKTAFPWHGKAMPWEVGVIKLTANRRQFSPRKPQLREKQTKLPDPMMGIKGIIASALADTSQAGRIQTFVLSQENQ
jgi:hypothetical protein